MVKKRIALHSRIHDFINCCSTAVKVFVLHRLSAIGNYTYLQEMMQAVYLPIAE